MCQAVLQQTKHEGSLHIQREQFELPGENRTNARETRQAGRVSWWNLESIPVYFCLPLGERVAQ